MNIESDTTEFKTISQNLLPGDLWEPVTAFSNSEGGTIYFGIKPDGERVGVQPEYLDKLQSDLITYCTSAFNHKIYPDIKIATDNVIESYFYPIPAVLRPLYLTRKGSPKGSKVRVGTVNIQVDGDWLKKFAIAANGGAELLEYGVDATRTFDERAISNYKEAVTKKRGDVFKDLSTKEILTKMRATNLNNKVTLFGLLGLSKLDLLQDLVGPTINIAITHYPGVDKVNPNDVTLVSIDDKEFNGNAVEQFTKSMAFIISKLPVKSSIEEKTGKRFSYLVVPDVAIRETLANAIAHRDYSIMGSRIQIDIYSDRIEFTNPGRSLIPLNQLEQAHPQTRNPLLMNFLKDLGITEHRGRGIRTIKESIKQAGLTPPSFTHRHDWFIATIYTSAFINDEDKFWLSKFKSYKLNESQLNALVHLRHNPTEGINNSEYRSINNMNSVGDDIRAKRELAKLVNLGLLIKDGEKRYRRYSLAITRTEK